MNRINTNNYIKYLRYLLIALLFFILYYAYLWLSLKNYSILILHNENLVIKEIRVTYNNEKLEYDTSTYKKITIVKSSVHDERIYIEIEINNNEIIDDSLYVGFTPFKCNIKIENTVTKKINHLTLNDLMLYSKIKNSVLLNE